MEDRTANPFWTRGSDTAQIAAAGEDVAPRLTPYLPHLAGPTPAVIVCPGGAYERLAPHEGEPIARWLNTLGIAAFVLRYRVAPHQWPAPLEDIGRAVRLVRHHAATWNVDAHRVGIIGFSAGGHLAAAIGTHHDAGNAAADDPVERQSSRPDFLVLCYALIDRVLTHPRQQIDVPGAAHVEPGSDRPPLPALDAHVTPETPPTFLWHTADDPRVRVENSLRFAGALSHHGVPFALHVYPHGRHGLGLAQDDPTVSSWTTLCAAWLAAR